MSENVWLGMNSKCPECGGKIAWVPGDGRQLCVNSHWTDFDVSDLMGTPIIVVYMQNEDQEED